MKLRTTHLRSVHYYTKTKAGKRAVQQLQNENQSKSIVTIVCLAFCSRLSGAAVTQIYRPHLERRRTYHINHELNLSAISNFFSHQIYIMHTLHRHY